MCYIIRKTYSPFWYCGYVARECRKEIGGTEHHTQNETKRSERSRKRRWRRRRRRKKRMHLKDINIILRIIDDCIESELKANELRVPRVECRVVSCLRFERISLRHQVEQITWWLLLDEDICQWDWHFKVFYCESWVIYGNNRLIILFGHWFSSESPISPELHDDPTGPMRHLDIIKTWLPDGITANYLVGIFRVYAVEAECDKYYESGWPSDRASHAILLFWEGEK